MAVSRLQLTQATLGLYPYTNMGASDFSKQPKALLTGKDMAETASVYCTAAAALGTTCQQQTIAA